MVAFLVQQKLLLFKTTTITKNELLPRLLKLIQIKKFLYFTLKKGKGQNEYLQL